MKPEEFRKMQDVLNELIRNHNSLVKKVDEVVDAVNSLNLALFETVENTNTSGGLDS